MNRKRFTAIITKAPDRGFFCHVYEQGKREGDWTIASWDLTKQAVKERSEQSLRENLDLAPGKPLPWQVVDKT